MDAYKQMAIEMANGMSRDRAVNWVRSNNLGELANSILDRVANAQSEEEADAAKMDWKHKILEPYFMSEVFLGGDKRAMDSFIARNPVIKFNGTQKKKKWDELKKDANLTSTQYGDKLLRMIEDPAALYLVAGKEKTPEDLRQEILDAWNEKQKELAKKYHEEGEKQRKKYLESIGKEFDDSWAATALGIGYPELKEAIGDVIKHPDENQDVGAGNLGYADIARSPKLRKAVLKDMGASGATFAAPTVVAKGASVVPKIAKVASESPLLLDAATGVVDAGIEAARQGMSDYYDIDPSNIRNVGVISATLPTGVKAIPAIISQFANGAGKMARKISKVAKGLDTSPAQSEKDIAMEKLGDLRDVIEENSKFGGENLVVNEGMLNKIDEIKPFMENSPNHIGKPPLTREQIVDIAMDDNLSRQYFTPPSTDELERAIMVKRNGVGEESDIAEEFLRRFKEQWNGNYNELLYGSQKGKIATFVNSATPGFSRYETLDARTSGKLMDRPEDLKEDPYSIDFVNLGINGY